ncbi:glucans biosynthesis glucosyltransferase MdoH [Rhodopirellula sallentina]|uniref:Glucans biosynthesis glucosyltransferase H n=1 Tax=Rhodopirellula sallentina SM41 TaxID=1263870 RepID=M5UE49_9BACT|nr:glucans biosynthesis glucosyltransferase MdoH [Rhodopirellula sallentina]EMI54268.1 periplasmic glucan biosynthesis protein [Rhodopirellula sallentina SM41]
MTAPGLNRDESTADVIASRWRVLVTSFLLWLVGCCAFYTIAIADNSLRFFEAMSMLLFVVLFGWIAFSFSLAMEGFLGKWSTKKQQTPENAQRDDNPSRRTAILMPVYNESPTRVFAAIAAMREQLLERDHPGGFDFFVLSDSTDPDVWLEEEWCWSELTDRLGIHTNGGHLDNPAAVGEENPAQGDVGIYYRHRSENTARKAGNVADFCENWGVQYRYMIVLDADSLISGDTIVEMVRRMDADDAIGILQVPPVPVGRRSLFARLQQFAAAVYGPMFAEGFDRFAGDRGNYWGHNAIIRTSAFMRHCSLPVLSGLPPLGGEILSHDFVEAALMVKAGWKVKLANDLGGSYEECPTTLLDFVKRDHRWCQGNLQHWRIMLAERIHPVSRMHFLSGILSYVAAPLWLIFLATTLVAAIINSRLGQAGSWDGATAVCVTLFVGSMALLLLPKAIAVATLCMDRQERKRLGGVGPIVTSAILETLLSTVLAPMIAVYHARCVFSVLAGHNVKWTAQQRSETGVSWSEASAQMWPLTVLGVFMTVGLAMIEPTWLIWFSPLLIGWTLSIPIAVMMGSQAVGRKLASWGLLRIASERFPEPILARHQFWINEIRTVRSEQKHESWFERLFADPAFRNQHIAILRSAETDRRVPRGAPEWETRCQPHLPAAAIAEPIRRRLLCDGEWVEKIGEETQPQ